VKFRGNREVERVSSQKAEKDSQNLLPSNQISPYNFISLLPE
jgi:hypothetical protein